MESRYPKRVKVESIGKSFKDNEIYMVRLSTDVDETIKLKNIVVIDAALHAREWISVSTILYFVENVVKHTRLLELMDIYVIPCANPDGYEFSHTDDRLWRKNMSSNGSSDPCETGVDLNRNFPYAFGGKFLLNFLFNSLQSFLPCILEKSIFSFIRFRWKWG